LKDNVIFTNVAITNDGDAWWEGKSEEEPPRLQSWLRREWYPDSGYEAAHPNARFTAPASQCPVIDPQWENPQGVPIDAIIFGGRRSTTCPLVYQAFNWQHGVFIGATMSSETTAAAAGIRGVLRHDPFAMRPFCGYNIGDYFKHWLSMEQRTSSGKLPKIFHVNWFKKNKQGKFLWPGFGDNIRVIDWILKRCNEDVDSDYLAKTTAIGYVPKEGSIDLSGIESKVPASAMDDLMRVDVQEWVTEQTKTREFLNNVGPRLPSEISSEFDALQGRLLKQTQPPADD
jgi:phosphoenolpyruvate carboxykinase (GTP)